ncbi:ctr copper transporter family [Artemisia annua]|uniref:Copper transport protein n=1 Tax=Artemisia annua TaxID=35608 RepID=A0A2U1M4T6_ARTAN|nr:ctr copper transporter family [Artemisia annua]
MNNHNMDGMTNMTPPTGTTMQQHHHTMMHMTFFWGRNGEILFPGWPGTNKGMYALVLIFVFFLSFIVEFLSHVKFDGKKGSGPVIEGLVRTLVHGLRVGLAYMIMLAVMSFNGGVFLVAVAGHALGFFVFGTSVFRKEQPVDDKQSDLSPMICAA